MNNLEKYNKVFTESFSIKEDELTADLEYNTIPTWDSVGHMGMVAAIEDEFDVELDMDDIIEFSSYNVGKELLKKYDVVI